MTINDRIRDEKLQYDINWEAAKISALLSGKIRKYEYLAGEDTLPSNQKQIIEQAKFIYSPLGKDCEKQVKTFKTFKPKEQTKAITYKSDDDDDGDDDDDDGDDVPISKEIYDEILEERMDEILKMSREINYSNLVYDFKDPTPSINFAIFGDPMYTYSQLRNGEKTLQQVEDKQKHFKKDLNERTSGNPKHKSEKQSYAITKR